MAGSDHVCAESWLVAEQQLQRCLKPSFLYCWEKTPLVAEVQNFCQNGETQNGGICILPLIAGKCWHNNRDHTYMQQSTPPCPPAAQQHLTAMAFP